MISSMKDLWIDCENSSILLKNLIESDSTYTHGIAAIVVNFVLFFLWCLNLFDTHELHALPFNSFVSSYITKHFVVLILFNVDNIDNIDNVQAKNQKKFKAFLKTSQCVY